MTLASRATTRGTSVLVDANRLLKHFGPYCQPCLPEREVEASWKSNLLQLSNGASFLCILDCTILPALTILLPILLGISNDHHDNHHQDHNHTLDSDHEHEHDILHELGHKAAIYFVLPVSGLALLVNFCLRQQEDSALALGVGIWGWICVAASNSQAELFGHGILHRVTNALGCLCLYLSNSTFQQQKKNPWSFCKAFCCGENRDMTMNKR